MIFLVTGAASSGKSKIAEDIATGFNNSNLFYIATMHKNDDESMERVTKHRKMRKSKGFSTIEKYISVSEIDVPSDSVCLLECVSNLLANEMYDKDGSGHKAYEKIINDIKCLSEKSDNLIIVTNEIFSDGKIYDSFCSEYINNLGHINKSLAEICDVFIEAVAGIRVYHKGSDYNHENH